MEQRATQKALAVLMHAVRRFGWAAQKLTQAEALSSHTPYGSPTDEDENAVDRARALIADEADEPPRTGPLRSIFSGLAPDPKGAQPPPQYYPLQPLALTDKSLFPSEEPDANAQSDLTQLWDEFALELKRLNDAHREHGDLSAYLETLMLLLQRYTWCVPAGAPDVSVYDAARVTAALAACVADEASANEPVALLLGGDLSGVQVFIYTITSKGAASALRGRSLYLQLLTEAIAREVLRDLKLPITNLLQLGGGHFYALARPGDAERLNAAQRAISQRLLHLHGGELYFGLASVPLMRNQLRGEELALQWSAVGGLIRAAKTRRFSELGEAAHAALFAPQGNGGNDEKECQVCGREHLHINPYGTATRKCPQCLGFEALGRDLREARYLCLEEIPIAPPDLAAPPGDWEAALRLFGLRVSLMEQLPALNPSGVRCSVLALADDVLGELKPGPRTAVGRRFLVNVTPVIKDAAEIKALRQRGVKEEEGDQLIIGEVKPFAALEAESNGMPRLGILRMDVDNLGRLFGLGERATLARFAALSFHVGLFFEGWCAELARRYNRGIGQAERDRVYSIYSGGDDLFFVGAWDALPQLALDIRRDLRRFAAKHPRVHASAGIALVQGQYPLYQAAREAQTALEAAKDRPGKNAVTLLGQTIDWPTFADRVAHWHTLLAAMVEEKRAPRGLLQRLVSFQLLHARAADTAQRKGQAENQAGEPQVYWGPWHWRSAYFLERLRVPDEATRQQVQELRDQLSGD